MSGAVTSPYETVLQDELARADRALSGVAPVLGHVLASNGRSLVSDAIVARVRGMVSDIARQLVAHLVEDDATDALADTGAIDALAQALASDTAMLSHLHCAAMEGVITNGLEQRSGLDPVLSPLWQELIASQEAATAEVAMQALTAQSRFMQAQRRMQQPLLDLPAHAIERTLRIWAGSTPPEDSAPIKAAIKGLKRDYDEAQTRTGLLARMIISMGQGVIAALELEHAGFALFVSALSQQTGQSRERCVLACHENQSARLAIALRAASLPLATIERQFLALNPDGATPQGLEELSKDQAAILLQNSARPAAWDEAL